MLASKIPWTEEPSGLYSMGSQRVGHDWSTEHTHTQAKECLESKEARIDKEVFSPRVFRWSMTCRYLAFRLLASRTVRKYISVVASHLVCGDCYVKPSSYVVILLCYDSLRKKYTLNITENHTRRNQQNGHWNWAACLIEMLTFISYCPICVTESFKDPFHPSARRYPNRESSPCTHTTHSV